MNKINTDVNYKTMAGHARLVMLGESNHNTAGYKYEAIKAIKQLKAAGFTHFAIEMLPQSMKEQVAFYQRTGKGFEVIQRYFNDNWAWGYLVPYAYGELVKAARTAGLKIVALDMTLEQMASLDAACSSDNAEAGICKDTHTKRNDSWTNNIVSIIKESNQHRVVAFMHRWHAVEAASYQEGIDTLIQKQGIHNVVFVDFIGGMLCLTEKDCRKGSAEDTPLKQQYFYREGFPYKSAIKSFQVHIPEKRVNSNGALQW